MTSSDDPFSDFDGPEDNDPFADFGSFQDDDNDAFAPDEPARRTVDVEAAVDGRPVTQTHPRSSHSRRFQST